MKRNGIVRERGSLVTPIGGERCGGVAAHERSHCSEACVGDVAHCGNPRVGCIGEAV